MWYNNYIGIEYLEGSRDIKNGGLDCWGLSRYILWNEASIELPALEEIYYDAAKRNRKGLSNFVKSFDAAHLGWSLVIDDYQTFDVLVLNVAGPFHIAVVTQKGWMLHVELGCNSVHERYTSLSWQGRIHCAFRHAKHQHQSLQATR